MDDFAKKLVEENYHLVEEIMIKYKMSEYDTPDWHGALSTGLCTAALCWFDDIDVEYKKSGFKSFAIPYMILAASEERPVYAVCWKVKKMYEDLSAVQKDHVCKIGFMYGDETTVDMLSMNDEYLRFIYT